MPRKPMSVSSNGIPQPNHTIERKFSGVSSEKPAANSSENDILVCFRYSHGQRPGDAEVKKTEVIEDRPEQSQDIETFRPVCPL